MGKQFRGVHKYKGKWVARLEKLDGDSMYLGYFEFFEDAVKARLEAESRYGVRSIPGLVKEIPFRSVFIRTVYEEDTDTVWIVARDLLEAIGYSTSNIAAQTKDLPAQFTATINCNSHTKPYRGVTIEGALIMLSVMKTPVKHSMRKWLFSYLYPRTLQKVSDQLEVIRATLGALDERIAA